MFWQVAIVSAGIIVLGLKLSLNPDIYGDYYDDKYSKGRQAIWRDRLRVRIGSLVCELDDQFDILGKLKERAKIDEIEEQEDLDIDLPRPDFSEKIGEDIQYLPSIVEITDDISEEVQLIKHLEACNDSLPRHRERIGWALIAGGILLIAIGGNHFQLQYFDTTHSTLLGIADVVLMAGFSGYHYWKLRKKRNILIDLAPIGDEES